jgi:hypothetical protein
MQISHFLELTHPLTPLQAVPVKQFGSQWLAVDIYLLFPKFQMIYGTNL